MADFGEHRAVAIERPSEGSCNIGQGDRNGHQCANGWLEGARSERSDLTVSFQNVADPLDRQLGDPIPLEADRTLSNL